MTIEPISFCVKTKNICLHFWKNASTHAKGFPDLFIFRGEEYAFIEVKSPNDHLSAIQHDWHQFFREQSEYDLQSLDE